MLTYDLSWSTFSSKPRTLHLWALTYGWEGNVDATSRLMVSNSCTICQSPCWWAIPSADYLPNWQMSIMGEHFGQSVYPKHCALCSTFWLTLVVSFWLSQDWYLLLGLHMLTPHLSDKKHRPVHLWLLLHVLLQTGIQKWHDRPLYKNKVL